MNPLLLCLIKFLNVAVHRALNVWPVDMNARKICWTIKKTFKIHHTTGRFIPKKGPEKSDFLWQ